MDNILSGLENMGLGNLENLDVFEKDESVVKAAAELPKKPEVREEDFLFDKSYKCPVCDQTFKEKTVRTGKAKLVSQDLDLRPRYQDIDTLKYDVVACPTCGYAAMPKFFDLITSPQMKLIREKISMSFTGFGHIGSTYSYDDAIGRHKLALVNAVIKRGKSSEKAYLCLKLAWLIRGKAENLPADTEKRAEVLKQLEAEENSFIQKAYEGFVEALAKENFPMCGLDETTVSYLIAELARRSGKFEDAGRMVSKILTSKTASERIKAKAREIKELIIAGKSN